MSAIKLSWLVLQDLHELRVLAGHASVIAHAPLYTLDSGMRATFAAAPTRRGSADLVCTVTCKRSLKVVATHLEHCFCLLLREKVVNRDEPRVGTVHSNTCVHPWVVDEPLEHGPDGPRSCSARQREVALAVGNILQIARAACPRTPLDHSRSRVAPTPLRELSAVLSLGWAITAVFGLAEMASDRALVKHEVGVGVTFANGGPSLAHRMRVLAELALALWYGALATRSPARAEHEGGVILALALLCPGVTVCAVILAEARLLLLPGSPD
mmetsp:Transcript_19553/g.52721  ORF Transcript_19553/g.52721 Transcript_19553/m.52721 type:complete len:270 (-) Transcript_19553:135-944(-)